MHKIFQEKEKKEVREGGAKKTKNKEPGGIDDVEKRLGS